jgi:hypothetical protein
MYCATLKQGIRMNTLQYTASAEHAQQLKMYIRALPIIALAATLILISVIAFLLW